MRQIRGRRKAYCSGREHDVPEPHVTRPVIKDGCSLHRCWIDVASFSLWPKNITSTVISSLDAAQDQFDEFASRVFTDRGGKRSVRKILRWKKRMGRKMAHLTLLANGARAVRSPHNMSSSPPPRAFRARCVAALASLTTKFDGED